MAHIVLIRQSSHLRSIAESEAAAVLSDPERTQERVHIEVPTAQLADSVDQGDWAGHSDYLREAAARIRATAEGLGDVVIHYLGLAEVPHIIALGAHIGTERRVIPHDHLGESGPWQWPESRQTVELKTVGAEALSTPIKVRGTAVMRLSLSYKVTDADVRAAVGDDTLADIEVTHAEVAPGRHSIRSLADVEAVRKEFVAAYGALLSARPGIEVIHLFTAAPPSVCFVVGQELVIRNGKPIQTYRYRFSDGNEPAQQPAILLRNAFEDPPLAPLTQNELDIAANVRTQIWPDALRDVERYVANGRTNAAGQKLWYEGFLHRESFLRAAPFPALPVLHQFMPTEVAIDPVHFERDAYGFEREGRKRWRLNDRLLLGLHQAADGEDTHLRHLIRLFLLHEYVHDFHSLRKHTAAEVGKFANCLEHIDYTADAYALLHQLDIARYESSELAHGRLDDIRRFLIGQVELAIRSFWAFDIGGGEELQVRRIRRYLNWYWRQVQIEHVPSMDALVALFGRQPHIELGGLYQVARGRRVLASLSRLDTTTHLEMAIVMEDEKLYRLSDSPITNLKELLKSFREGDHKAIRQFFRAAYDKADGDGGTVLPAFKL